MQGIIDADRHVMEPPSLWRDHLDPRFRDRGPVYGRTDATGPNAVVPLLDGQPVWRVLPTATNRVLRERAEEQRAATIAAQSPAGQLAEMDRTGIAAALLFPTIAGYLVSIDTLDGALTHALADAYNRWLLEFCAHDPGRLLPAGLIARHLPERMAGQVRELARRGVRAVVVRPNPVAGRTLSDPSYEGFWAACQDLDVAVCVHEGTHARVATTGADRFATRFGQHACSHPLEQMMALLSLVEGGVLERHPRLRVAFLEAGCGWLPSWLWRLDEVEYRHLHGEVAGRVSRPPSEYFRRQCWVAFEPSEPLLPAVLGALGTDRVLFGTDFPHLDHEAGVTAEARALEATLGADVIGRLMTRNAADFLRLSR